MTPMAIALNPSVSESEARGHVVNSLTPRSPSVTLLRRGGVTLAARRHTERTAALFR